MWYIRQPAAPWLSTGNCKLGLHTDQLEQKLCRNCSFKIRTLVDKYSAQRETYHCRQWHMIWSEFAKGMFLLLLLLLLLLFYFVCWPPIQKVVNNVPFLLPYLSQRNKISSSFILYSFIWAKNINAFACLKQHSGWSSKDSHWDKLFFSLHWFFTDILNLWRTP